MRIFPRQCGKVEFARRAGGQVVRKICVVVSALRRSVSFFDATNWNLAGRQSLSLRRVDRRLLPWQSPSNSRTRNVIHRRGAHLERPAEKFLIFRFLSAKRCHLAGIFAKTHGTIPSGTQRRNDNTPGPSRLVSRHCRPRLGSRPCPAGAQDDRPYEVRRKAVR